jgi:hypothetical protein
VASANIASGLTANASGDGSVNIATGNLADASGDGSANIALGNEAIAIGDGTANMAFGSRASATGTNSIAIGTGATATGSIAIGEAAFASNGGAAFGDFSTASGLNSTAIGPNAVATHNNAAAFGNGATTTRVNQQVFGTASNTYTMPGVTSQQSRNAQGAPTHIVTTNVAGDLAAHTLEELGFPDPVDVADDISNLQQQINGLGRRDRQLTEGLAAVAALAQPILLPGQNFAMRGGWGAYDDANAVSFTAAGVVAWNLLNQGRGTLTLDGGLGFGTSEGQLVGRAGASFGW